MWGQVRRRGAVDFAQPSETIGNEAKVLLEFGVISAQIGECSWQVVMTRPGGDFFESAFSFHTARLVRPCC